MSQASQAEGVPRGGDISRATRREVVSQARHAEMSQTQREETSQAQRDEIPQAHLGDDIDVKPKLNLLINHVGQEITVRVKANMLFKKIFDAAAQRFGKEPGTLRFGFAGTRIKPDDTPALLEMDDNDQIDAFMEQLGGDSVAILL